MNIGNDTKLNSEINTGYEISAVALDENRAFIAHSGNSNKQYLYGVLCIINNQTISIGTEYLLDNTITEEGNQISAVNLSNDTIFITYFKSGKYLYGKICKINGTNITSYTSTQLTTTVQTNAHISAVALNKNKVFIVYGYDWSAELGAMICTINKTTITINTTTRLSKTSYSSVTTSVTVLDKNKIFIAHNYDISNYILYGMVCTINNNVISAGTDTKLCTDNNSSVTASVAVLNENKVFIAHRIGDQTQAERPLYGLVCTISGTTITKGTDTKLGTIECTETISIVAPNENKVFIFYTPLESAYLYMLICAIDNYNINYEKNNQLSQVGLGNVRAISSIKLQNKVIVFHNSANEYLLYGIVLKFDKLVQPLTTSTDDIYGVAKDNGTEGDMVDVYRPYEEVAV